jgi:hypothetical protein
MDASHFMAAPDVGFPIPLWQLVYHDALVCRHFVGPASAYWGAGASDFSSGFLRALVLGDTIMVLLNGPFLADSHYRSWLRSLCSVIGRVHGEVANQEMIGHRFLTDDHGVKQAEFSSGTTVTVNMRIVGYMAADGYYLPPQGYHVRLSNGEVLQGHFGHIAGPAS